MLYHVSYCCGFTPNHYSSSKDFVDPCWYPVLSFIYFLCLCQLLWNTLHHSVDCLSLRSARLKQISRSTVNCAPDGHLLNSKDCLISSILSDLEQTGNWSDETQQTIVYCQIFFQADPLLSVHQNVNKRRYVVWLSLRVDLRIAYATAVSA